MSAEAKHEPGPWHVRGHDGVFSEGRCVARMDWEIRDTVDDANANLIAAAPDLLLVAREALHFITNIDNSHPSVRAIRAAIAKAGGARTKE